jgi:hypothetical protein
LRRFAGIDASRPPDRQGARFNYLYGRSEYSRSPAG